MTITVGKLSKYCVHHIAVYMYYKYVLMYKEVGRNEAMKAF